MSKTQSGTTKRRAFAAGALGVAAAAAVPSLFAGEKKAPETATKEPLMNTQTGRMPVVFLPHGGGPWPFVELGMGSKAELDELAKYLRSVGGLVRKDTQAVLVISAHWEERVPTVMTSERPPMLYDYYGFPPESYQIQWPAPGQPKVAARVRELLSAAGIPSAEDAERGFDHGTFVPLKLAFPEADVPIVQLSLKQGLDPAEHLAIGRALGKLRDEGVLIVGSGMTFHNLRAFNSRAAPVAEAFDAWLRESATQDEALRDQALTAWSRAPSARQAHPREEHLLPLMVIAGAAGADKGVLAYNGTVLGLRLSAYQYGA